MHVGEAGDAPLAWQRCHSAHRRGRHKQNNGGLSTWCHTNAQEYRIQEGNVLNADSFASTTVKWLTLLKGDPAGSLRKQHSKGCYENLDLLTAPVNFNCSY